VKRNKWLTLLNDLYCRFQDDGIPALGSQIAYSLILSFFPFVLTLLTLISYTPITGEEVLADIAPFLPAEAYETVKRIIDETLVRRSGLSLVLFLAFALHIASNGVMAMIRGLNKAYDIEETRSWFRIKFIASLYVTALIMIMVLSFAMLVFGEILGNYLLKNSGLSEGFHSAWNLIRYIIPLGSMTLVFMLLYSATPGRPIPLKGVIPGAVFSTLGWSILSLAFSYYVNHFVNFSPIYGSLGGMIALLIWLYWSSVIILLGGEINAALYFIRKGALKPKCKQFGADFPLFKRNK